MRLLTPFFLTLALCASAPGQDYTIRTFAGGALLNDVRATSVRLTQGAAGAAVDGAGNTYFAANAWNVVFKVDAATGLLTRFAGNGTAGYSLSLIHIDVYKRQVQRFVMCGALARPFGQARRRTADINADLH